MTPQFQTLEGIVWSERHRAISQWLALRSPRTRLMKLLLFTVSYIVPEKKEAFPSEERNTLDMLDVQTRYFAWHLPPLKGFFSLFEQPYLVFASAREVFFPAALIQRNLPRLSVFRHGGWSSTIPEALGSAVISWLSEHNGWKLSYYLSVLSKGKGSCGEERPRKTLVLILLKGVGQPSQILFSWHAM